MVFKIKLIIMKTACVLGGGGFIGNHMVTKLKELGYWVRAVDVKLPEYSISMADEFAIKDLRSGFVVSDVLVSPNQKKTNNKENSFDLVFQFAADMGGMGYLAGGGHDADVMYNSAIINLNVAKIASKFGVKKLFFSSSACVYPMELQETSDNLGLKEKDAIPAHPDLCYGWEKLHSEWVYDAFMRNYGLSIRIGRFHNIFGTHGTYENFKAKAPAALCFKVANAKDGDAIEVWGDGLQTRSFLYIDECIEGILRLMDSNYTQPVNIGSDEMVSINTLAQMIIDISGKDVTIKNIQSDKIGVTGRNSDNTLINEVLGWKPSLPLSYGLIETYNFINKKVNG